MTMTETRPDDRQCTCGSPDTYSLDPNEVVIHRTEGPCYIGTRES